MQRRRYVGLKWSLAVEEKFFKILSMKNDVACGSEEQNEKFYFPYQ